MSTINTVREDEKERITEKVHTSNHWYKKIFGSFSDMISGTVYYVMLIKCFTYFLNATFSVFIICQTYGFNWRLFFVWWEMFIHLLFKIEKLEYKGKKFRKIRNQRSLNIPIKDSCDTI